MLTSSPSHVTFRAARSLNQEVPLQSIHSTASLTRHHMHVCRKVLFARMTRTVTGEFSAILGV